MVAEEDVAAMRFLLNGDYDAFGRVIHEMDRPGQDRRLGALMGFTILWAARARFGNDWSRDEVTRYAEQVRARSRIRDVPVRDCEAQILAALEDWPPSDEPAGSASTDFALIMALGGDLEASTRGLVLAEAREQADRWLEWCARYGPPVNGAWQTKRRCRGAVGSSGFRQPGRCQVGRRRR